MRRSRFMNVISNFCYILYMRVGNINHYLSGTDECYDVPPVIKYEYTEILNFISRIRNCYTLFRVICKSIERSAHKVSDLRRHRAPFEKRIVAEYNAIIRKRDLGS